MVFKRKPGITILLVYSLGVTILRALRTPNDFAEAHWLLDYRFGFVKRGLVGEMLTRITSALSLRITENLILILSGIAFLVFCVGMVYLSLKVIQNLNWSSGAILTTLVFLTSPFMVMSAHLFGYYDNIVIVLGILSVILLLKGKLWSGVILQGLGMLIHENSLFLAFVPFCLTWFLMNFGPRKPGAPLPLLLPVGTLLYLAVNQEVLVNPDFNRLYSEHLSQFPFIEKTAAAVSPLWLSTSFSQYFELQSVDILRRVGTVSIYLLFLPSAFGMLFFILAAFPFPKNRWRMGFLIFGVCFAPQSMHLVAWDTFRIWTYTIFCAFFALWVYSEIFPSQRDPFPNGFVPYFILMINAIIPIPLMDGQVERFSFLTRLVIYIPVLAGGLVLLLNRRAGQEGTRVAA